MYEPELTAADMRAWGERVKWARELVEPNRSAFARRMEIDVSTIRKFEEGQRGMSVTLLDRIIHSLRLTYDYVRNGNLNGIDLELAVRLVARHPELMPQLQTVLGKLNKGAQDSTSPPPTTPNGSAAFL